LADEQIKDNKVLVIVGDNWQPGVVGLVAGRITEKYHRPSLVITRLGNKLVGSGRSIEGFNITEAIEKCSDLLLRFGGHEGACGFTVKSENDLTIFEKRMNEIASLVLSENDLVKILDIDMKIELSQTNISLVEEIESMGPFGIGNPTPKFASFGVRVESANFVGGDKHLKIRLSQGNFYAEAISFGFKDSFRFILSEGDLIDIAYELSANIWNGHKSVQLKIIDIKKQ